MTQNELLDRIIGEAASQVDNVDSAVRSTLEEIMRLAKERPITHG